MFLNLKEKTNNPIARTNIIQLNEESLDTINRLLIPISNIYAIDFFIQEFPRVKKESGSDYFKRLHKEVKVHLRHVLELEIGAEVKYELHKLESGQYACFYVKPLDLSQTPPHLTLAVRIEKLCKQLTKDSHDLNRLVQGLFGLHLKMILLEQARERFEVEPIYFNSAIYLNARLSKPMKPVIKDNVKTYKGIMEAFELDIFASKQKELIFTLHKCKFEVEPAKELHLSLDEDRVWFNTSSGKVESCRKLDARGSSLKFLELDSNYGRCQAYTYNVVMNTVIERLIDLEIPYTPIIFQANYEVDQFSTDLDKKINNTLLVVNNGVDFNTSQEKLFFEQLEKHLPNYQLESATFFEQTVQSNYSNLAVGTSLLVLNPVAEGYDNSIQQTNSEFFKKTKSADESKSADEAIEKSAEYPDFFDAYEASRKQKELKWDYYTQLKIDRLNGWLGQNPLPMVSQGINIDKKMLTALDAINDMAANNPTKYMEDLKKPRSKLNSYFKEINNKLGRTKTELWFKESLFTEGYIPLLDMPVGCYTAFSVRIKRRGITLLGYVELEVTASGIRVVNSGVTEGDLNWLAVEHPALARLEKLFNNSFYLHDHSTDALLTSYTTARVPRIIGNTAFNAVDFYTHQEQEKSLAERNGQKFKSYITRTAKSEDNVMPYLFSPGRKSNDRLVKSIMKHHHIYLSPHEEGLYLLVSDAQPADTSMVRSNLVENLLIWDNLGKALDVFSHPLTQVYVNSFTLDMLRKRNSSKSSIFAKLAKLMVEN